MSARTDRAGVRVWSRWTLTAPWWIATVSCRSPWPRPSSLIVQAGVPVVLSTGRSWHGTQPVFDQLGLPPGPTVCSNGAVIVRYPPQEIIKAITFDPRPVIAQVEDFAPGTLIAVEEIGRGYRLNELFPGDDLTGELIIEDAEAAQLAAGDAGDPEGPHAFRGGFSGLGPPPRHAWGDLLRRLGNLARHRP